MSTTVVVGEMAAQLDWMTRDLVPRTLLRALLWVRPDGGQRRARRNAWSSMVEDTQRRTERLEVERSVALAQATAGTDEPSRFATA